MCYLRWERERLEEWRKAFSRPRWGWGNREPFETDRKRRRPLNAPTVRDVLGCIFQDASEAAACWRRGEARKPRR